MDKIPFEMQRVINELVGVWQTLNVPRALVRHINELYPWEIADYFRQVSKDLCIEGDNKITAFYATFSAAEFKLFLEFEYRRLDQIYTERQAQAKVVAEVERQAEEKAKAERQAQARVDFDVLGKEMANETARVALVELGRKRADLAPFTGVSYSYKSHCWNCHKFISSDIHARCPVCKFYICSSCSSCLCGFDNYRGE